MIDLWLALVIAFIALLLGGVIVLLIPTFKVKASMKKSDKLIKEAEQKCAHLIKTAQLDAKQAAYELKIEADKEIREKKMEVEQQENKLLQREQGIDRRDAAILSKETVLEEKQENLNRYQKELEKKENVLQQKLDLIISELEKVSAMSIQEVRDELFKRVEEKIIKELADYIKTKE